jgi:hypothetical protein
MYLCDLLPCVEFSSKKEMRRRHMMRFLENLNSSASLDVAGRNVMKDNKFQYFPSTTFQIILVLIEHQVEKSSLLQGLLNSPFPLEVTCDQGHSILDVC